MTFVDLSKELDTISRDGLWKIMTNNNEKFKSFKSKENIHKKEVGPYRGFGY